VSAAELFSENLPKRGTFANGTWRLSWFWSPHGGASLGGDRFGVVAAENFIGFWIADAAGHGRPAEQLWRDHGLAIRRAIRRAVGAARSPDQFEHRMRQFARDVNRRLVRTESASDGAAHLCVSVGLLSFSGEVTWANFGYGSHVLALTRDGVAWNDAERLFGLKLGWLDSDAWELATRSMVTNSAGGVERLVLLTDGFLPSDHRDVNATLGGLRVLGESCRELPHEDVVEHVRSRCPSGDDDVSLLVIDRITSDEP
jgi:hypothetical protein